MAGWVGGDIDGLGVDEAVVVEGVGVLPSSHRNYQHRWLSAMLVHTHSQVALLSGQLLSNAGALDQLGVVVA